MTALLLHELEIRLARGLHRDASRAELPESTARVLLAVDGDEHVLMGEIARRIGRDPTTATRFVDRAVREGLVDRAPGVQDRRRRLVTLTSEGRRARARLLEIRTRRAEALTQATLAETGLGLGQVEWFLDALLKGLQAR